MQAGKSSIQFEHPPIITSAASIVGQTEGEGPLASFFDRVEPDPTFGKKSWEEAESELQRQTVQKCLDKAGRQAADVNCLFAGDLLGQIVATSFGVESFDIPFFGLYGACSTMGEALSLGAMAVAGGYGDRVLAVTSSHFGTAEKEFRFPLDYGSQRPLSASWTVTGSGAFALGLNQKCRAHITGMTPGRIVDYGLKDSMNMGACMAPAAADTVARHMEDFHVTPEEYDRIITGDLGSVGQTVLIDLLREKGIDIADRHMDCGIEIFDAEAQDTHAGGSGCGCSAVTLAAYVLPKLESGEWKKVLFLPTGALLSKTSFNEGKSVPGIAHAVVLESPAVK